MDNIISSYSRSQALADGILIDVSQLAREAGFRWPVALTTNLYSRYIVPPVDLLASGQSVTGRLWDVLNVLRFNILGSKDDTYLSFTVSFLQSAEAPLEEVELLSVVGPGDDGSPVFTIMLPEDY